MLKARHRIQNSTSTRLRMPVCHVTFAKLNSLTLRGSTRIFPGRIEREKTETVKETKMTPFTCDSDLALIFRLDFGALRLQAAAHLPEKERNFLVRQ
jgi:hypothetical protein